MQFIVKETGNILGAPALDIDQYAAAIGHPLAGQDNLPGQYPSLVYHLFIRLTFILNAGPGEYDSQGGENDQDYTKKKFPLEGNPKFFHN